MDYKSREMAPVTSLPTKEMKPKYERKVFQEVDEDVSGKTLRDRIAMRVVLQSMELI